MTMQHRLKLDDAQNLILQSKREHQIASRGTEFDWNFYEIQEGGSNSTSF